MKIYTLRFLMKKWNIKYLGYFIFNFKNFISLQNIKTKKYLIWASITTTVFMLSFNFTYGAVLEIKRDFSKTFGKNSQNVLILTRNNYINATSLFNRGGSSSLLYSNGSISVNKTPLLDPKQKKYNQKEIQKKNRFYTVLKGDTISGIAKKFNVSQNTIIWENNIKKGVLKIGQELVILPVSGITYKIKKGDTLSKIAKNYSISISKIKEFNNSLDKELQIGQKIILPGASIKSQPSVRKTTSKKTSYVSASSSKISLTGDGNVSKYINWRGIVPYGKGAKISVPKRKDGRYKYTKTNYGYFTHPAPGTVRTQGIHGRNSLDMGGPRGTNIYAAANGKVIKSSSGGWGGGYGTYIIIEHPNGVQTMYAHNSKNLVWRGEEVKKGQVIAKMGSTGRSTGNHVHFEVRGAYNPF